MSATFPAGLIRPWYPAGKTAHTRADCPELLRTVPQPQEGPGWLDPRQGPVCGTCMPSWNAVCHTCGASLAEARGDGSHISEGDAKKWMAQHECEPEIGLVPPKNTRNAGQPANQLSLFDIKDAA
ncbi:hypothetical protein [Microbispora triticiradicis]|uniref:hypothetical protein n=1 Tax=Microbispora triticiradicis TaxID=2200763 RepID=UPI001AD66EDF|nr:hypothetical protein [Microbispora triticiradicis]MBO4273117.1 hypothetical protein [Microbispora triticiradicis]